MNAIATRARAEPRLRVYRGDDSWGEPLTLTRFALDQYFPFLVGGGTTHEATLWEYMYTLKHWRQLVGEVELEEITTETVKRFSACLARLGLARRTQRKHLQHVRAILGYAAPASPGNQNGTGQITEFVAVPLPKPMRTEPRGWLRVGDLACLARAADRMTRPRASLLGGVPRGDWWRAIVWAGYHLGLRPCALLRLRWADFEPVDECGGRVLNVRPEINKQEDGYHHYCHPDAVARLDRVRSAQQPAAQLVFAEDWPRLASDEWEKHRGARQTVSRLFGELAERAGVKLVPGNRLKALRKTCATELAKLSDIAAMSALGHRDKAIISINYAARLEVLKAVILTMPTVV